MLCSCSKGFETITLKSIRSFKLGSAKSMFAFIFIYFLFRWFSLFKSSVCVCLCICFVRTYNYSLCARGSWMPMQPNVILQCKVYKSEDAKGEQGWTNFSPWSRICDITEVSAAVTSKYRMAGNRNSFKILLNYRSQFFKVTFLDQRPCINNIFQ